MKNYRVILTIALAFCASIWCASCSSGANGLISGGSNLPSGNSSDNSGNVSDPTSGNPFDGSLSARVRNESSERVDVTMRFIREDSIVHLAFVRVPPSTITSVTSPEMARLVELSGVDETGRALDSAKFTYGVDFDERTPAEYVVVNRNQTPGSDGVTPGALRLSLLEPSDDVVAEVGTVVSVQWDDGGAGSGATVRIFLRPEGAATASALRAMSPAISASLDGINDEFSLLVQDVPAGTYELVAELTDGDRSTQAVALGRVLVRNAVGNKAPKISITKPSQAVELLASDVLEVAWSDRDDDDNATVVFSLERPNTTTAAGVSFVISPPIAENPDGAAGDSTSLSLIGVLPGLYDLVATIDDGALQGSYRMERAVRVLPPIENDPPRLTILTPASDMRVVAGSTIEVRWSDGDANDDARVSFLIDSNWSRVDLVGGERLLLSGVSEDADGGTGSARLTLPSGLLAGKYRLVGVITDGMTQVITRAPGFIFVSGDPSVSVSGGGTGETAGGGIDGGSGDDGVAGEQDPNLGDGSGAGDGGQAETNPDQTDDSGGNGSDPNDPGSGGGSGSNPGDSGYDGSESDGNGNQDSGSDPGDGSDNGSGSGDSGADSGDSGDDNEGSGDDESGGGSDVGGDEPGVVVVEPPRNGISEERVSERPGEPTFEIGFVPQSPVVPAAMRLTNEPYGGDVSVELPAPTSMGDGSTDVMMQLRIPLNAIPNYAWPRSFDLIVTYVIDGAEQIFIWPRPIEIPQLVEVTFADLNVRCDGHFETGIGVSRFRGLSIGWFGGGVDESVALARVDFWLSRDGLVPGNGLEDHKHRLVYSGLGHPNDFNVTQVDLATLVLGGLASLDGRDLGRPAAGDEGDVTRRESLLPGVYSLITVVDYGAFGRVISRPDVEAIQVCPSVVDLALNN